MPRFVPVTLTKTNRLRYIIEVPDHYDYNYAVFWAEEVAKKLTDYEDVIGQGVCDSEDELEEAIFTLYKEWIYSCDPKKYEDIRNNNYEDYAMDITCVIPDLFGDDHNIHFIFKEEAENILKDHTLRKEFQKKPSVLEVLFMSKLFKGG